MGITPVGLSAGFARLGSGVLGRANRPDDEGTNSRSCRHVNRISGRTEP
jgi:hypothetical protein